MLIAGLLKIRANEARMEVANTTINNSPTPIKQTAPRPLHGLLKFRGYGIWIKLSFNSKTAQASTAEDVLWYGSHPKP
jgi:hypothetical protein